MESHTRARPATASADEPTSGNRPGTRGHGTRLTWDALDRLFPRSAQEDSDSARVERALVIVFFALRLVMVGQLAVSLWFQQADPRISLPVQLLTLAAMAFSLAYMRDAWRRGSMRSAKWGAADLASGLFFLVATSWLIPEELHFGSWLHWAPGYTDQVAAMLPTWLVRMRWSMAGVASLSVTYFLLNAPGAYSWATVWSNTTDYLMFGLAASLSAIYVRGLAEASDRNRNLARDSEIARLKAESDLEIARYSFLVHGASGLLECFARGEATPSLRQQAAHEAARLRHEGLLPRQPQRAKQGQSQLGDLLAPVLDDHADLPLRAELWLGQHAVLPGHQAAVLAPAVRAVLDNVRRHAHANNVTVHADVVDQRWEVSIVDDGVGFDADPTQYGFGLSSQVVGSLCRQGITVEIESSYGEGTWVQMTGPLG